MRFEVLCGTFIISLNSIIFPSQPKPYCTKNCLALAHVTEKQCIHYKHSIITRWMDVKRNNSEEAAYENLVKIRFGFVPFGLVYSFVGCFGTQTKMFSCVINCVGLARFDLVKLCFVQRAPAYKWKASNNESFNVVFQWNILNTDPSQ